MAGISTVIACIWDFDKTLIPFYSEAPLFNHFHVKEEDFWNEVNGLVDYYKSQGIKNVSRDTVYLNHILTYVEKNIFKNLNNKLLFQLGAKIPFYSGLPEFFGQLTNRIATNATYQKYDIVLEHYIVSTGLYEMIHGSKIGNLVDGIWANEFVENPAPPKYLQKKIKQPKSAITQIAYMIDNTTKTRAIYEINKGANKIEGIDVNTPISKDKRRVPIEQIIYIADGPSDIPSFSAVNQNGGTSYGVYKPGSKKEFEQAYELFKQGRIQFFSEADYRDGSQTNLALTHLVDTIAEKIVRKKQEENLQPLPTPQVLPQHIVGD